MTRIHTDLSRVPISVAPSPATSGTSLGVTDANAALLPDVYPYWAVLVPTGANAIRANSEIVKVTGGSSAAGTTTLTIVRAQGIPVTTAQTVTTGFDIYDANSANVALIEDGWTPAREIPTYNAANKMNVASGAGLKYQIGTKFRWKQGAGYKYGVAVTVADTLVTIQVTTDFTVANSAITDFDYSNKANPLGWPGWFSTTTPTISTTYFDDGAGGQPTITESRINIEGRIVHIHLRGIGTKAGTNPYIVVPTYGIPDPLNTSQSVTPVGPCWIGDLYQGSFCRSTNPWIAIATIAVPDNTATAFSWSGTYEI